MRSESLNYYEVLEVAPDADQESIYNAYCSAKKTFNLKDPEIYKIFSPEEAREWAELIEEAYSVIGFANSRRGYDQEEQKPSQQNLPSFEFKNSENKTELDFDNSSNPNSLPEGYGETRYSRYKLIKNMEDLIAKQDSYDGLSLKKIREYKNIDLTDFSKITCIAIRHLRDRK